MLKNTTFRALFLILLMFKAASVLSVELNGSFKQGGLIIGKVEADHQVYLDNKPLMLTPEGVFVIGFGRDAEQEHVLEWGADKNSLQRKILVVEQREYPTQYVEGVPQQTVTPPKSRLERIRKESALVKNARKTVSQLPYFSLPFKAPMDAPVTGVYGSQRVYNGVPKRPHYGVDYAGPVGAPVYAPASGVVSLVHNDMFYSGGTLIVDHGLGVSSTFIHLSEVLVKKGDQISQGDLIARVGQGGRSTGPHLDWRINWFDVRIDPQLVLDIHKD